MANSSKVVYFLAVFSAVLVGCTKAPDNEALRLCGANECCKQSLDIIRKNNYQLATDNLCQEGKKLNSLGCAGSLRWCE